MGTQGFIENHELLKEDSRVKDCFDLTEIIKSFTSTLDRIDKSSIIGLVGKFGSGKSTMLHQIYKAKKTECIWVHFDAWKYPDRKDLWEGFVIDFASQVGEGEETLNKIDGKNKKNIKLEIVKAISGTLSIGKL